MLHPLQVLLMLSANVEPAAHAVQIRLCFAAQLFDSTCPVAQTSHVTHAPACENFPAAQASHFLPPALEIVHEIVAAPVQPEL